MLNLDEYTSYLKREQIPPAAHRYASHFGMSLFYDGGIEHYEARRRIALQYGLWTVLERTWVRELAAWLDGRRVLEIMAGGGWLAKGLAEQGVPITATDDFSWKGDWPKGLVHPVKNVEAQEAVIQHGARADVLLACWPPYDSDRLEWASREWGSERPIVYIGEGTGGCNASEAWWAAFRKDQERPTDRLLSWPGIHDRVASGFYHEEAQP